MLDFISQLHHGYLYPTLFIGHIFLGGFILIPALYLSTIGKVSFFALFVIIVTSSMVSDSIWYFLGKNIRKNRAYSLLFIKNRIEDAKKFSSFFERYGVWTVFFTKFISGTRLTSHILAGMHDVDYLKFLAATGAGTSIWFTTMFIFIKWFDNGIAGTSVAAFRIQIVAIAIILLLVFSDWFTRVYVKGRLMNVNVEKEK